jgi:hypothetical protein
VKNQWCRPGSPSPATPITAGSKIGRTPVACAGFGQYSFVSSPIA